MCGGYYSYEDPHEPTFNGEGAFKEGGGQIVHPQRWTEQDVDYEGKHVAVIGSGATAITIVPSIAQRAAHVTMVQRSPSYFLSAPERDPVAMAMGAILPQSIVHPVSRWKNTALQAIFFRLCRSFPAFFKDLLVRGVEHELRHYMHPQAIRKHFTPRYNPWDQRLCLTPGGDFFDAIRRGRATVVTDHIDTLEEGGIRMKSGELVRADLVIAATGITLQPNFPMSTVRVTVDGKPYDAHSTMLYKGIMCSDVPNFAFVVGYTNASWTLKADLACGFVARLLNHMRTTGMSITVPEKDDRVEADDTFDFDSGYVLRAKDKFPQQGKEAPWRLDQNFFYDKMVLEYGNMVDGTLKFARAAPPRAKL